MAEVRNDTRELEILKFLQEHLDNPDPAFKKLVDSYPDVVDAVMDARLDEFSRKFTAQATYLTASAGIASLLASVQIGFIPLIGVPDCGTIPSPDRCDPHSRLLPDLIIFFSYVALSFDTLGALFSLLAARKLLGVSSQARDLLTKKSTLERKIIRQKGVVSGPDFSQPFRIFGMEAAKLLEEVHRLQHVLEHHTGGGWGVISFILLGISFFFVALISQVVISQPIKLWIPFIFGATAMAGVLAWDKKRTLPGVWMKVRKRIFFQTQKADEEAVLETIIHEAVSKPITKQRMILMLKNNDIIVQKKALNIIATISQQADICAKIQPSETFQSIGLMLETGDPSVREPAARTVISLVQYDGIRKEILKPQLLDRVTSMLHHADDRVKQSGLEIIAHLVQYSDCRAEIDQSNIGGLIIPMLGDANIQRSALTVVANLAQHDATYSANSTKPMIQRVILMLQEPSGEIQQPILEIIDSLAQHQDDRAAISTRQILQRITRLLMDADPNVRVAALRAVASLIRHDDVVEAAFTQDMIRQILSLLKDRNDVEVPESTLEVLAAILRRGKLSIPAQAQVPAPSSVIFAGDGPHNDVRELLKTVIQTTKSLPSVGVRLAQASIERLLHAAPNVRKSYTEVAGMFPWESIPIPSNEMQKLITLLNHSDNEVTQCAIQLMVCFASNAESRYRILSSDFCASIVHLLNNPHTARQAVLIVATLGKYDDARPKIIDPKAGIVNKLVQIVDNNTSGIEHWEVSIQGLLALRME